MQQGQTARPTNPGAPRIIAVVVTYNRVDLLGLTLRGIAGGTRVPDRVVVVDNASTDATPTYLAGLDSPVELDVVRLGKNLGGAGGFTAGIDRALNLHDADLVWVMDDDTEPLRDTLAEAERTWREYSGNPEERPAFVASKVVWTDGREHPMNAMRERILPGRRRREAAAAVGARTIRSGSFVSLLMDAAAMRRAGLPHADYFIWNDDFEYSTRLARFRDAVQAPASVVTHHTKKFGTTDVDPGPRFYYDVRNKLWVFTRSQSLAPWEKVLYFGATSRLWWRTFRKSSRPRPLCGALVRGIRDAIPAPRSNEEVFAGIYELDAHRLPGERAGGTAGDNLHPQPSVDPEFSLLMPVYHRDRADALRLALASNTWEQTLPPWQVVIAVDGPLPPELDVEIESFAERARGEGIAVDVIRHPEHRGLPATLNEGLEACRHGVVARADADDASLPGRFEAQVPLVSRGDYAVLGASMYEADASLQDREAVRQAETGPRSIARAFGLRNPIFHPTVVFDAAAVRRAGGYEQIPGAEDYALWARMMRRGEAIGNLSEPLVVYRSGRETWDRRGGTAAMRRELVLQSRLRAHGLLGRGEYVRNLVVRGGYRFIPTGLRIAAFRRLIGSRGGSAAGSPAPVRQSTRPQGGTRA